MKCFEIEVSATVYALLRLCMYLFTTLRLSKETGQLSDNVKTEHHSADPSDNVKIRCRTDSPSMASQASHLTVVGCGSAALTETL
jgi:hypothetical protein